MLSRLSQRLHRTMKPLIFVDFDETITTKDTIGLLGQTGVQYHGSRTPWSFFVQAYLDDYKRKQQQILQKGTTLKQQVEYMDQFRHVEKASLDRISHWGILSGFTRQQLYQAAASQVTLQPSVQDLLEQVGPTRLYIVSLNWSKDWIRGALLSGQHDFDLKDDHMLCNDLVFDPATQKSTGIIQPSILNTSDKFRHIESILQQSVDHPRSIYIGDSMGDLLPLVECDIGIIIGKNQQLLDTLAQAGIIVKEGLDSYSTTNTIKVVYQVNDWQTILKSGILA
ncbi:HAD-like domain-containing protein [Halteromyces radiatus]|uniref:HAD-like domain-containing protein n=1 Tax=Halteromyces radiatus TaxID=101107 RepID=UPI00221F8F4E|nr:HAD-like domain-containing protein [Halteromyces radiatus]KAI8086628.1 HAD-like domain-containing protein [Halteromyces radiatus]